jgi:hypothetical protein
MIISEIFYCITQVWHCYAGICLEWIYVHSDRDLAPLIKVNDIVHRQVTDYGVVT